MRNRKLARRYAQALGDLAFEQGRLDEVEQEMEAFLAVLNEYGDFRRVLEHQEIEYDVKAQLLREMFEEQLSKVSLNFLLLVVSKQREVYLEQMIEEFRLYANAKRGILEVEVTTAAPLTDELSDAISKKLEEVTGKRVRLMTAEDERILGGVVAKIGDLVMDGSVKTRLERLRETLKRAQMN